MGKTECVAAGSCLLPAASAIVRAAALADCAQLLRLHVGFLAFFESSRDTHQSLHEHAPCFFERRLGRELPVTPRSSSSVSRPHDEDDRKKELWKSGHSFLLFASELQSSDRRSIQPAWKGREGPLIFWFRRGRFPATAHRRLSAPFRGGHGPRAGLKNGVSCCPVAFTTVWR